MPPAPPTADEAAPKPVFVDDSGRRHRAVRALGLFLGAIMVGYLALLGISLVGSPGLVPLSLPSLGRVLPGPAAPLIPAPAHSPASPGDLVAVAVTPSAAAGATSAATSTTATTTRPPTTARPAPTATPRPAATPTPSPTAHPTPSPKSTPPTTHRPSTHPSPHSTKRSTRFASPTPTATAA